LDHRIVEFAAKLPSELKVDSRRGKLLLRASVARRLPPETIDRGKRGFSIPAARWLRTDLRALAESVILDGQPSFTSVLDKHKIRQMWQDHVSEARDHSVFFWGLMMLGMWEMASSAPVATQ